MGDGIAWAVSLTENMRVLVIGERTAVRIPAGEHGGLVRPFAQGFVDPIADGNQPASAWA